MKELNDIKHPAVLLDADFKVKYTNSLFESTFGFKNEDMIGKILDPNISSATAYPISSKRFNSDFDEISVYVDMINYEKDDKIIIYEIVD
ncbi:MAG: hypothetical protein JXR48_18985 [Candidatus Delongbacteria bacterium]|nr:hypothetical protein [Candidatus Delongbacteria bacterium]MBN2837046.1 hypothetical protein [Candidatus Delongbacteria bacterium]